MKVRSDFKKEGDDARLVLTGAIINNRVCGAIHQKWTKDGLFGVDFMDRIGTWCVRHFEKYKKAPGSNIQSYFGRWAAKEEKTDSESKALESFLSELSEEYVRRAAKSVQPDYVLKVAEELFTKVKIRKTFKEAERLLEAGHIDKADELIGRYGKVEMTEEEMIDFFEDENALKSAWEEKEEVIVEYPGAAGVFFGNRMRRKAFVSFEAAEKVGKSFMLLDVASRAIQQSRKVAYFEVGDLTRLDVYERLASRVRMKSIDTDPYQVPISLERFQDGEGCNVILEDRKEESTTTWEQVREAFQKIGNKYGKGLLKTSSHPAGSISINGIRSRLDRLRTKHSWTPDVVIIDYADILAPVNGTADTRDQINKSWMLMRALASSMSCLVVTATQTNRASYGAEVIDMQHASEDKRKRAHVTMSVGINQTDGEKEQGVTRLNVVVGRHKKFSRTKCLYCAGSLAISAPMMFTSW